MALFNIYKELTLRVCIEAEDDDAAISKMLNLHDAHFEVLECEHFAVEIIGKEEPSETTEAVVRAAMEAAEANTVPAPSSGDLSAIAGAIESLCHQIGQMRGLFDDEDGTIAGALEDADDARAILDRLRGQGQQSPPHATEVNPVMKQAFIGVLRYVIEQEYPELDPHSPGGDPDDLKSALANAIETTAALLDIEAPEDHPNPAEYDGPFYDWAAEAGFQYGREDDQD